VTDPAPGDQVRASVLVQVDRARAFQVFTVEIYALSVDVSDVMVFAAVVRAGGFSAAARELDLPPSAVSRRVKRLEQRLGTVLLHRTTRNVGLTAAGRAYYERVARSHGSSTRQRRRSWRRARPRGGSSAWPRRPKTAGRCGPRWGPSSRRIRRSTSRCGTRWPTSISSATRWMSLCAAATRRTLRTWSPTCSGIRASCSRPVRATSHAMGRPPPSSSSPTTTASAWTGGLRTRCARSAGTGGSSTSRCGTGSAPTASRRPASPRSMVLASHGSWR